ncbi:MAG: hypothetical protein K2I74_08550, partial [Treponemataceae bacterium]|nr:hypothetical protein [Treponemataceae bacterium]
TIDAFEVDARSQTVPDSVKTRSGGTTYSNFDTVMGNTGLGLSADPTGPQAAKTDVLNFSGRHNSDFAHNFANATDDASYAKNDALNNALVNYKTGFKYIQGTTQGGTTGSEGSDNEGGSGNTGTEGGNQQGGTGTQITADVTCHFTGEKANSSVEGAFTVNGNCSSSKGTAIVNGTTYTSCLKMESATSISFKIESSMTLTLVFASGESGKKVKVDGTAHTTDSNATVTVSLNAGEHTITKGDSINLFYIALKN